MVPSLASRRGHGAKRLADRYRFVLARRGMRWRGDDRRLSGCRDSGLRSGGTRRIGAIDPAQRMHATREWPLPIVIPPGAIITIWRRTLSKAPPIVASSRALRWYARLRERPLASSRSTRVFCSSESWDSAICRPASRCRFSVRGAFYFQPNAVPSSTCRPPASWPSIGRTPPRRSEPRSRAPAHGGGRGEESELLSLFLSIIQSPITSRRNQEEAKANRRTGEKSHQNPEKKATIRRQKRGGW
jgi:hypothetical protein